MAAAPGYEAVVREAGFDFPDAGNLSPDLVERLASLLSAAWAVFDRVVDAASAELRKGPRGGRCDRGKIVEHVLGAEVMYARKLGIRMPQPALGHRSASRVGPQARMRKPAGPLGDSQSKIGRRRRSSYNRRGMAPTCGAPWAPLR